LTYTVKEIFYTLQGEGLHAGRPAVFCRFSGCNLWTGRERDRPSAICTFCDTDFWGVGPDGGKFHNAGSLADAVALRWNPEQDHLHERVGGNGVRPFVVCTGGEPLLQLDEEAINAFHARGFEVAVETNGTQDAPKGIDHICVSPKANAPLRIRKGNELKLVYPQVEPSAQPERFADLNFGNFFLQPMDGPELNQNIEKTIAYCMAHPKWRLSIQTHKIVGIR
jgi:7-carboxy-7-deazaguanine synthase